MFFHSHPVLSLSDCHSVHALGAAGGPGIYGFPISDITSDEWEFEDIKKAWPKHVKDYSGSGYDKGCFVLYAPRPISSQPTIWEAKQGRVISPEEPQCSCVSNT